MSDAETRGGGRRQIVVGTAGHIDHGKTTLIRALTGIDTDRLAEEKRRGISIDLGFAHMALEGGGSISFVDVPGHERFIKNMLAGVGGIEAVLLVVAADESVKPQTREHFDICRLLGIEQGIVVLTKSDLTSPEQLAKTQEDVKALCAGSFLERAAVNAVSAATGVGLDELRRELGLLAGRAARRGSEGSARLPIDRSFALKGFGTVVTGTLRGGALRAGETVRIHPMNREARIRGLQMHGGQVDRALAGQRCAVNLAGVDHSEIFRGCVLTHGDGLETSKRMDVSVEWMDAAEIPVAKQEFLLHAGTAEIRAELKPLARTAEKKTLARLWLGEAALVLPGDRFVLRRPSPARTVAGGVIIDAFPPARLNRAKTVARLLSIADADLGKRIEILARESTTGRRVAELIRLTGETAARIETALRSNAALVFDEASQRAVTKEWVEQKRREIGAWLAAFHAKNPSLAGAPMTAARMGLDAELAKVVFHGAPGLRAQGDVVSLATHRAELSSQETQALAKIEHAFRQAGFQPAPPAEVLKAAGLEPNRARGLLESLVKSQKLVRVSESLIFHAEVIAHVRKSLAQHKGRRFSVPEFKEWTQISRKYAIPLLEYLDHQRVTRREGDARVVL
ncbi:MAG: selenocysteine-specific translation elongation factor [Acidobacteriaceae bacterium]|nr:selenocysteine-specific translation elongation factor [Acidobacteriaceae bacterium]